MPSQYFEAIEHAKKFGYTPKKRAFRAPRIVLGERDFAILSDVHRFRVMSPEQISARFFPRDKRGESSRERLAELYQNGYLERMQRPRDLKKPQLTYVYRLASRGAATLAERAGVNFSDFAYWGKYSDGKGRINTTTINYVEHWLQMTNTRMAIEVAAQRLGCRIERWLDHYDLIPTWQTERVSIRFPDGASEDAAVTPDGYFVLSTPKGRGHFFLEVDNGSDSVAKRWHRKILIYKQYLASGKFHQTYQVPPSASFRMLAVTRSLARSTNFKYAAERYGPPETAYAFLSAPRSAINTSVLSAPVWLRGGHSRPVALV
jgi:hypothetical protein